MKSRPSLKNSARAALNLFLLALWLIPGCSSSTKPTYLKENIAESIQDICKKEYNLDVKTQLVGSTIWVYVPVEDLLIKNEKPEKYTEKFEIKGQRASFNEDALNIAYAISPIPDKEATQDYKYNKKVLEKTNNVWKAIRRVFFSMGPQKEEGVRYICMVTADIKNGFETKEIFQYEDLKKVSYQFISWKEYQHRSINQTEISTLIIGDKEGLHLRYTDISLKDFISWQIEHRIKLKFQKPEVEKNADIDKEILKIAVNTMRIYGFTDFSTMELNNLITQNRLILNEAAMRSKFKE